MAGYVVQGKTIALPVAVRDATSMTAMFVVPTINVRPLIPAAQLRIAEIFPGRTVCVIAAIDYRDNDLGQYNEISVAFFVRHGEQQPWPFFGLLAGLARHTVGAYIHRLPVTTSFSRDAGRDIWGFPKTVDDIGFQDEGARRSCRWAADGQHVLSLSMLRGGRRRMPDAPQRAYAWRDGVLYETPSIMGGEGVRVGLAGVTLTLGTHPIADELRHLGLPKRALLHTWTEHMHARFDAPQLL